MCSAIPGLSCIRAAECLAGSGVSSQSVKPPSSSSPTVLLTVELEVEVREVVEEEAEEEEEEAGIVVGSMSYSRSSILLLRVQRLMDLQGEKERKKERKREREKERDMIHIYSHA